MEQTNLKILQFLKEDLEKTEAWTFHYVIEEALDLSPMVVDISLAQLEQEKMITRCLCGCNGIMIAPAGYDALPKPEKKGPVLVWKTEKGDLVRLTHMSDRHLANAVAWLLREQNLDPEWRGEDWSDLSEIYQGAPLGVWIQAITEELCSRIKNG